MSIEWTVTVTAMAALCRRRVLETGKPFKAGRSRLGDAQHQRTDTLDRFVEDKVRSGEFHDASEVVDAGLTLLKRQADSDGAKLALLRSAIQEGLDELDRGEGEVVAWDRLDEGLDGLGTTTAA